MVGSELVRGENMLIAPTFGANRVAAWELKRWDPAEAPQRVAASW